MQVFAIPELPKGLIFDMDNTLYTNKAYSLHQEEVLVARLAQEKRWSVESTQEAVDAVRGEHKAKFGQNPSLCSSFETLGIPVDLSIRWRNQYIRPEDYLKKDSCLEAALKELKENYCLSIISNNPRPIIRRTLACLGLSEDLFVSLIGLDSTGLSKPAPEAFIMAQQHLGLPAASIVSLGDRYAIDLEPALSLGMGGILIEHVEEILDLPDFFNNKIKDKFVK